MVRLGFEESTQNSKPVQDFEHKFIHRLWFKPGSCLCNYKLLYKLANLDTNLFEWLTNLKVLNLTCVASFKQQAVQETC